MGEKASTTNGSFLHGLFLQRLPSNVCMVLASIADTTSLDELASLAEKIMEVAMPTSSVSVVSQSQLTSEMERLCTQISDLQSSSNNFPYFNDEISPMPVHLVQPQTDLNHTCVGTIKSLWMVPRNVMNTAPSRELLGQQPLMATGAAGHQPSHLFYVTDCSTGSQFLVDTGAEVSIVPPSFSYQTLLSIEWTILASS